MTSTSPSSQRRVSTVPASSTVSQVLPSQELSTNVVLPSAPVQAPHKSVELPLHVGSAGRTWKLDFGALADTHVRGEHATLPHRGTAVSERRARRATVPGAHLLHLRELHLLAAVLVELRGRAEVQERLRTESGL